MTEERIHFLRERLSQSAAANPAILELREKLLSFGGIELVVTNNVDPDLKELLERGQLLRAAAQLHQMNTSACHENVAHLWYSNPGLLRYIGTGYALTRDGLWRQHSWGIKADGTILETTELRSLYFGLLFDGDRADFFVFCNSTPQDD